MYYTALQAAETTGNELLVSILLGHGVEVNTFGREFGTALQAASAEGHYMIVARQLERGADVNLGGGIFGRALQAALRERIKHRVDPISLMKQLLRAGAQRWTIWKRSSKSSCFQVLGGLKSF
jgi:hypothetical protein